MAGELGEDGLTRLGVAGALYREYAADEKAFLAFLADSLDRAFGSEVERLVKGGFLSKKVLRGVVLSHGDARYTLEDPGDGALKASITHVVRGIALKTELIKVQEWLAIISEIAEARASEHAATRKALQDMLGLS
jgi:hypothetical protein